MLAVQDSRIPNPFSGPNYIRSIVLLGWREKYQMVETWVDVAVVSCERRENMLYSPMRCVKCRTVSEKSYTGRDSS